MVNVAFSPSRIEAQNTTAAQLFIIKTLHGVITGCAGKRNGEIAHGKVNTRYINSNYGACK